MDGPNPDDPAMFLKVAEDYILRIRNHVSVGFTWAGKIALRSNRVEKLDVIFAPSILHSQLRRWRGQRPRPVQRPNFRGSYFEQRATTNAP